jgi:hypothetical protein
LVGVEQEAFEEREGSGASIAGGTAFGGEIGGVGGIGPELARALEFGGGSVAIPESGVVRGVEAEKLGGFGFDDGRGALEEGESASRVAVVAIPGGGVDVGRVSRMARLRSILCWMAGVSWSDCSMR